jgi:hypothetical protein
MTIKPLDSPTNHGVGPDSQSLEVKPHTWLTQIAPTPTNELSKIMSIKPLQIKALARLKSLAAPKPKSAPIEKDDEFEDDVKPDLFYIVDRDGEISSEEDGKSKDKAQKYLDKWRKEDPDICKGYKVKQGKSILNS